MGLGRLWSGAVGGGISHYETGQEELAVHKPHVDVLWMGGEEENLHRKCINRWRGFLPGACSRGASACEHVNVQLAQELISLRMWFLVLATAGNLEKCFFFFLFLRRQTSWSTSSFDIHVKPYLFESFVYL